MARKNKIRQIGETIQIPEDSSSQLPSIVFYIDGKYYEELGDEEEISEEDVIKYDITVITFV